MKRRVKTGGVLAFAAAVCAIVSAAAELAAAERQVIHRHELTVAGVTRASEVLRLVDTWIAASVDGYTWRASPNALGTFQNQTWVVMVDGQKFDTDIIGVPQLNMLPLDISAVDSVEVFLTPVIHGGAFTDGGLIHFHTMRGPDGTSLVAGVRAANETGDPGPYRFTEYESPNVDSSGPDGMVTFFGRRGGWHFHGTAGLEFQFFTDSYVRGRTFGIIGKQASAVPFADKHAGGLPARASIEDLGFEVNWPATRRLSALVRAGRETSSGAYNVFFGYASGRNYFLFDESVGREIPINSRYVHGGIDGQTDLAGGLSASYNLKHSLNRIGDRPDELEATHSWGRHVTRANLETAYARGQARVAVGATADHRSLDTGYELTDDDRTVVSAYATATAPVGGGADPTVVLDAGGMMTEVGGRTGGRASAGMRWRATARQALSLRAAVSDRAPAETDPVWYWVERGYGFYDDFAQGVTGAVTPSRLTTLDAAWRVRPHDRLRLKVVGLFRHFDDFTFELHDYAFDPATCAFVSPVTLAQGSGDVIGAGASADVTIHRDARAHVYYAWRREHRGDAVFARAWRSIPRHRAGARFTIQRPGGITLWMSVDAVSESTWEDYAAVDGAVCVSDVSQATYSDTIDRTVTFDVKVQKWFMGRRLAVDVVCRNAFDTFQRTHPAGKSDDLTFLLQLRMFLGGISPTSP